MAVPLKVPEAPKAPPPSGVAIPSATSTTSPSFASPQIQTAPQVATSQSLAGNAPKVTTPEAPTPSPAVSSAPPGVSANPPTPRAPRAPVSGPGNTPNPPAPATPQKPSPSPPSGTSAAPSTPAATPTVTSAPSPTVPTSTGAPPGVPATAPQPTIGLAPTPKSMQGENAREEEYTQAQNEYNLKVYEAALKYNGGPDSDIEAARRAAEVQNKNSVNARGAAGTIDSSLRGEDQTKIETTQAVADEAAYKTYQEAVATYNDALNKAQEAYLKGSEVEKREMAEQAEKNEPKEPLPPAPVGTAAPAGAVSTGAPPVIIGGKPQPTSGGTTVKGKYVTGPKGERIYQAF